MKNTIRFFAPMIPPSVTSQEKKLATNKSGKPYLYNPENVTAAKEKLTAHFANHRPDKPLNGAVYLMVQWHFPCGNHTPNTYKTDKPDTDNLNKLLKDVLTTLKYYHDDAQVAYEVIQKFWADIPGIYIEVGEI